MKASIKRAQADVSNMSFCQIYKGQHAEIHVIPLFRKKIALFQLHLKVMYVFCMRNDRLTIVYVATSCLSKNVNNSSANHIAIFHNLCHIQTCHQGNHVNHS